MFAIYTGVTTLRPEALMILRLLRTTRSPACYTLLKRHLKYSSSKDEGLKETPLYSFHLAHGGKMVPFAGYLMPLQYSLSIIESVLHTRNAVSIFDVSHMQQMNIYGKGAVPFIESLTVSDVLNMKHGQSKLSLLTNEKGGIIDDCIITKVNDEHIYIVSNAANSEKDKTHILTNLDNFTECNAEIKVEFVSQNALIAVQGPQMKNVLQPGVNDNLDKLYFMNSLLTTVFGIPEVRITRCGYTGEDGVELSVKSTRAVELAERLISQPLPANKGKVEMAGLAARDTLRLEAGLCLYGNDISDDTTPVEANLTWCIGKRRREKGGFKGSDIIVPQIPKNIVKLRIGLTSTGAPARAGTIIYKPMTNTKVGTITSGGPSPVLGQNIAIAYVKKEYAKLGTQLILKVRKNSVPATVTSMPFLPSNYYLQPKV